MVMHFTVNEKFAGSNPAVKALNGYLFVLFFGFFFGSSSSGKTREFGSRIPQVRILPTQLLKSDTGKRPVLTRKAVRLR